MTPDRPRRFEHVGAQPRLVLGVDDSAISLRLLQELVTGAGYAFVGAASGAACLEALAQVRPAVILLDVVLPGMDGFETCRRIRLEPRWARIPVLFLSGLESEADVEQGMEVGGNDFILKPFTVKHLLGRLAYWAAREVPALRARA